jgi:hypothetical protein
MTKLERFEDPADSGNSSKWHTGKPCIEKGCAEPAGTAWSHLWCFKHNAERIKRIDASLKALAATEGEQGGAR